MTPRPTVWIELSEEDARMLQGWMRKFGFHLDEVVVSQMVYQAITAALAACPDCTGIRPGRLAGLCNTCQGTGRRT